MRLFEGTPFDRPPRCERCDKLLEDCACPPAPPEYKPPGKQTARVAVENRKHGRRMTVVRGLPAADNDLPALLTKLKSGCGAGGAVVDDQIEIQGDHVERVEGLLRDLGYRNKSR